MPWPVCAISDTDRPTRTPPSGICGNCSFPAASEKTKAVLEKVGVAPSTASESETAAGEEPKAQSPRPGHGRNGADEFTGANRVVVAHQQLHHGDRCPACGKGNVYN